MSEGKPKKIDQRWRDVMPCYLSVQDTDLRIIEVNDPFIKDFGNSVGEHCFAVYKNADRPCVDCPVLQTFRDGKVHTSEEKVVRKNGEEIHVVVSSAPLLDENGEVAAVMEMSTNITEIKSLRSELKQSRRNYKHLFDAVPCYICVLGRDLKIKESNLLYRRDFGETEGIHCYEACKKRNSPCVECLVQKTFIDGAVHQGEEILTTKEGKRINLIVYSMPIHDDNGNIVSVMEVLTDITEVKKLQRRLALMGRAVAGMAHRVKNILMGLEGGIFVVNTGMEMKDQPLVGEGWEMVERNVGRVSKFVYDLLYCSKERKPNFKERVSPEKVLREVHKLYDNKMMGEDIDFNMEINGPHYSGKFDRDGLYYLLNNLVANAIDACRFDMSEDKVRHTITLRLKRDRSGNTVFEIEDDGAGIPEDVRDKMFEEFFSTKGTEGTGIGLLVVQKVAEEHSGKVTFTTETGKGTTFVVTIPPAE